MFKAISGRFIFSSLLQNESVLWHSMAFGARCAIKMAMNLHEKTMHHALSLAEQAARHDDVPVGAVVYDDNGTICGEGHNRTLLDNDPTAHAEIVALRAACAKRQSPIIDDLHLAVTLEACAM